MSHTKEPWLLDTFGNIVASGGQLYLGGVRTAMTAGPNQDTQKENARRIVACVNACKRIDTLTLEGVAACGGISSEPVNQINDIAKQRDELLAALSSMVDIARLTIGWAATPANADGPLVVAEELIARVKGGA